MDCMRTWHRCASGRRLAADTPRRGHGSLTDTAVTGGGAAAKRLRIVVPRYGAAVVGGAESAMRQLAHALTSRGWDVQVWTTTAVDEATWSSGFAAGVEHDGDVEVRRFPLALRRRPRLFQQISRAAYHLPRPLRPEHLWSIAQGPYAPTLVRALSDADAVPTLFSPYLYHPTLFGLPAASHPRILCPAAHDEPALALGVVRRAVLSADALWFHSPEERELLLAKHPSSRRLPWRSGVVGVTPPAGLDDQAFRVRQGIVGPYLYYGGRAAGGKGMTVLTTAATLLRNADPAITVVVSGDAGDIEGRPQFRGVGRLDERARWEAIAGAAAVVVPGSMESLSLLALEAWSLGRPCLLNAASPVLAGHVARGGGGLLFHAAEDLATRATELVNNRQAAAEMGAAGRAYVTRTYRWDLAEERLEALITGRVNGRGRP